jgi:hypothetical protein
LVFVGRSKEGTNEIRGWMAFMHAILTPLPTPQPTRFTDQMGRKDKDKKDKAAEPVKKAQQIFNDDEEESNVGEEAGGSDKVCMYMCRG